MIGQAAFEAEWQEDDLKSISFLMDQRPLLEYNDRQWFVAEQVLIALQTEVIRAGLRLNRADDTRPESGKPDVAKRQRFFASRLNRASDIRSESEKPDATERQRLSARYFEDLNDCDDSLKDLDPLSDPSIQLIDQEYWSKPSNLLNANINLSYCEAPFEYIHELGPNQSYRPAEGLAEPHSVSSVFRGNVFIVEAQRALRRAYYYRDLPDAEWFARYQSLRNRALDEIVAAAWRFIAVERLEDKHGCNRKVINAMEDYIATQGLGDYSGVSGKVLEVLAGKIVRQWRQRDLRSLVVLNSTPETSGKPKK